MKNMIQNDALSDAVDNWLKEEMKLEAKISVWDFDDNASYLDKEHREKCEAKHLEREHQKQHSIEEKQFNKLETKLQNSIDTTRTVAANNPVATPSGDIGGSVVVGLISIFFVFVFFVFIFIMFSLFLGF